MSALRRAWQDYPRLTWMTGFDSKDGPECQRALDEIDRLRVQLEHYRGWYGDECRCDLEDDCPL